MRLKIRHETAYHYDAPVSYALQRLRLTPKSRAGQTVVEWAIDVEGGAVMLDYLDQYENRTQLLSVSPGSRAVTIASHGEIDTEDRAGVVGTHGGYAPLGLFRRPTALTQPGETIRAIADSVAGEGVEAMHALMGAIADRVAYRTGGTDAATPGEDAAAMGQGVCQDHTHIFIAAARLHGRPARYVSGYLMMNDRADQAATHAWAETHIEDLGWVGFDPSNRISPDARYVRVASGLDYRDAAPISGVRFGNQTEKMDVHVRVEQ